ncbi:MAG TPA: FadR/GntR family transcriptional regulator [Geminicoccaceae bacterium]|nr:FadR/GntR family transcriptional regulator [Geminicoccus sp.]HMU51019.1 FadR/GntR family transcriptional regulator [Geminicoccaceae bacterium]
MTELPRAAREQGTAGAADDPGGLTLVPGTRERLGDQLYRQLLDRIHDGRLKEGDRLPSENEISAMFGVSRPIVRSALLRLRLEGLLNARQGSGTYVTRRTGPRALATPEQVETFLRCVEVRLPIEGTTARLAAQRRTPEQLAAIDAAHDEYRRNMEAGELLYGSDLALHLAIADASGNPQFADVLRHVEDPATGSRSLSLSLHLPRGREKQRLIFAEHDHVVEAIRAGDAEAAQMAMQFHISQIRRRLIEESRGE